MSRCACVVVVLCAGMIGCALDGVASVESIEDETVQALSVPPYTVRLVTPRTDAEGGPSNNELTLNSQVRPGTAYYVSIDVSGLRGLGTSSRRVPRKLITSVVPEQRSDACARWPVRSPVGCGTSTCRATTGCPMTVRPSSARTTSRSWIRRS